MTQQATCSNADTIRIESHIREEQPLSQDNGRRDVLVTILRGGASINGYYYNEQALRSIARLVENAQAYVDHAQSEATTRSVRDMVGFYSNACYVPSDEHASPGRVDATLHILESSDWLWRMIREAHTLGHPELIGLSVDIFGTWQPLTEAARRGRQLKEVTSVLSLNSCDIVTRPSAGGSFQRLLHSLPADAAGDVKGSVMETPQETSPFVTSPLIQQGSPLPTPDEQERLLEQQQQVHQLLEQVRLERAQLQLDRRLLESPLPEAVKAPLRTRYSGRIFEMGELERDLTATRQMMADLASAGLVHNHGYEKAELGMQITEAEKIQAAFDRMFDLDIDTARLGTIRGFSSIREAYARVTGDASVTTFSDRSQLGSIRISETAPIVRISEADTTTASFSYLLGTSMNKRLLKDYQSWPAEWSKFCTIAPLKDFKQQTRVRLGAFGSLSTVPEDTAYSTISLTDSAATYVPVKRGNLVTVSRETIVNDDLFAIRQIPTKLASAAAYTLAEFVYAFLSANPNIYDGNALFTAGAPHNNLGTSALSTASMQAGVTAMREQTNFAGKRLGLRPKYLIVPPELEFTSMVVTKSAGVPGSPNNDINPMLGYVTPIVSPQLTSTTQWFFAADPGIVDTIEIGFVGGQVNPALFIQDQPLFGLNFTQDVISYKCRHEYGGCIVDYRGLYRGI